MLKIREAVIVEGRYDKIKLSSIVDAPIIETNGFRVFSDKEKQSLIRKIAETRGILIMTDSDGAGFVIRNFRTNHAVLWKCRSSGIPLLNFSRTGAGNVFYRSYNALQSSSEISCDI